MFEEGSKLEEIGDYCFSSSGLEEITLPKSLKNICDLAFTDCEDLKTIYVDDGCEADLSGLDLPNST